VKQGRREALTAIGGDVVLKDNRVCSYFTRASVYNPLKLLVFLIRRCSDRAAVQSGHLSLWSAKRQPAMSRFSRASCLS
jgi:hypothetical protein